MPFYIHTSKYLDVENSRLTFYPVMVMFGPVLDAMVPG